MNDYINKIILSINALTQLKRIRMLNPVTASMVIQGSEKYLNDIQDAVEVSKLFCSPFEIPGEDVNGFFKIALTENNRPVGINEEEVHTLICGQTSCGKTTLLKILFSQVLLFNKINPYEKTYSWIFAKAPDFRSLLKIDKDILFVTFKEIKINPLEPPPNINPIEWAGIIADVWIQAFRLYDASKSLLIECLQTLYDKYSPHGYYPTLFDLYDYLKGLKFSAFSRTARYQESVLNRLTGLIYSSLAPVFDCSRSHINYLTDLNVVFELLYLTSEQQVFIVNYLLSYLFHYKLINETGSRHFVAIDDANLIFDVSYEKRPDLGLPIIHHLLTTVRKSKINIFACTQTPHQIGASMHSNSFAKIMFSLSNGKDIEVMQHSMGIRDSEQKDYCYKLKPREAVVKFSARYQEPFLARIPEVKI